MKKKKNAAQMLSEAKELIEKENMAELLVMFEDVQLFLDKFKDIHELASHLRQIQSNIYLMKEFLPIEEAARYLGFSKSQLYKMTSGKEIAHYKPSGKSIFLSVNDINEWVRQNRIMPNSELYKHTSLMAGKYMLDRKRSDKNRKGGPGC